MGTWTLLLLSTLVHTGFCCFYFKGLNFSDQRLVIRRERDEYCIIKKTTPHGSTVPCEGNATATRINDTHVLLRTYDDPDVNFMMEYGRDNEPGKFAEPYPADCPDPSPVPGKMKNPDENFRVHYVIWALVVAVIIIIIVSLLIFYKKFKKKSKAPNCSGNSASSSNDSSRADLMDDENMNKKEQV